MYYDRLSDLGIKLTRRGGQEKTTCPQCSDGRKNKRDKCLSVNIDNGEYNCHNCGFKGNVRRDDQKRRELITYEKPTKEYLQQKFESEKAIRWFEQRGISKATLDKFMIFTKQEWMPQTGQKENCICFPYFRDADMVNIKFRDGRKNFKMVSKAELILYNLNSLRERKKAILVEGEIDCLSLYEAGFSQNLNPTYTKADDDGETKEIPDPLSEWAIISVPNGASKGNQRLEYLDNCSDWLLGIDEFIIATDGDEAGVQLRDEIMRRLGVERCKFALYPTEQIVPTKDGSKRPVKDANEVLLYFGKNGVQELVFSAQSIPVDGVFAVEDIFESMLDGFKRGIQLAPTTHFKELDNLFRWKKGEINLWSGYANHGKSFFVLHLMLTKSIWDGWKWAIFSPENYPANDFYDDLIEMYNGKWLNQMTEDEYVLGAAFINDHFFYVYPENEHDLVSIHEKFRYLVLKKGVDGVMIDPWNQLDHLQKAYQREDQYLSQALKDVKRFALLNSVSYNIIAHPKTPVYQEGKQLPTVDMYDLYGGSMWGNKADQLVIYERPNWHFDKSDPTVRIHIQKVKRKRTGGQHGSTDLRLLWSKKRYTELPWENEPCDPIKAKFEKEREQKAIENGFGYEQKTLHLIESVHNIQPPKSLEETEDWGDQPF